jgi:phosphatidylserine decarboxylase
LEKTQIWTLSKQYYKKLNEENIKLRIAFNNYLTEKQVMITKYGIGTFALTVLFGLILILAGVKIQNLFFKYFLITAGVIIALFTIYFFRDPDRITPQQENAIISPADGRILSITKVEENRFLKSGAWKVSIFMSPLNVHVNRIPISGKVGYLNYIKGEYLMAFYEKADERNERNEVGIDSKFGKVLFVQIAGFMARRIVSTLQMEQPVTAGERFGMIKFGSRVDVYVPVEWNVKVKTGDNVFSGESILFETNK